MFKVGDKVKIINANIFTMYIGHTAIITEDRGRKVVISMLTPEGTTSGSFTFNSKHVKLIADCNPLLDWLDDRLNNV